MWQLDGPQDGQRPHEGRDFGVLFINTPQHRNTLGDGGEKPAETLWLSEMPRVGGGRTPPRRTAHSPDSLCCPPLTTTHRWLLRQPAQGTGLRMKPGSGWDTDRPRRQVPPDQHHRCGPPPQTRGTEKRQCSPEIPTHHSRGRAPQQDGPGWGWDGSAHRVSPSVPPPARGSQKRSSGPLLQEAVPCPQASWKWGSGDSV